MRASITSKWDFCSCLFFRSFPFVQQFRAISVRKYITEDGIAFIREIEQQELGNDSERIVRFELFFASGNWNFLLMHAFQQYASNVMKKHNDIFNLNNHKLAMETMCKQYSCNQIAACKSHSTTNNRFYHHNKNCYTKSKWNESTHDAQQDFHTNKLAFCIDDCSNGIKKLSLCVIERLKSIDCIQVRCSLETTNMDQSGRKSI